MPRVVRCLLYTFFLSHTNINRTILGKSQTTIQKMTTTMAASMEQCTETSQGILTDVVEWLTEEIIFTDNSDDLLEKWETLEVNLLTRN